MPQPPDKTPQIKPTEITLTIKTTGPDARGTLDRWLRNTLASRSVSIRRVTREDNPQGDCFFAVITLEAVDPHCRCEEMPF